MFMAKIKLGKFIKNLERFSNNPMSIIADKKTLFKIIYSILYLMAYYTRPDTAQGRYSIIGDFAEKYGYNPQKLKDEYFYWEENGFPENSERMWGNGEFSTISESVTPNKYSLKLVIDDPNVVTQENGQPGSKEHPRTEKYSFNFFPYHLTYVEKLFKSGKYDRFNEMNWNVIVDTIHRDIEKGLFK